MSILKNKGYTIVDSKKGFLQIVRSSEAPRESPPFVGEANLNQIQTDIIYIKNLPATQMMSQIRFLLSKYGKLTVSKDENSLIATDYPENIKTIKRLIKKLDSQKEMKIHFHTLLNAKASLVLPKIRSIAKSMYNQKIPSQKVDIFLDEATNSLIIVSREEMVNTLVEYLQRLDKSDFGSQRTPSYRNLKNSDAITLEKLYKDIINTKPISGKKLPKTRKKGNHKAG